MASALSERLSRIVKEMRGQARITESNITDMLREVRMALLEADVALPVVRDFIARVKERALGAELSHHLGYRPGATKPEDASNHRNGARHWRVDGAV